MGRTHLSAEHHKKRIAKLKTQLDEEEIDTFLVFNSKNVFYLTGLSYIPTERPIAYILHKGESYFFVPSLEIDHVQHQVPFVAEIWLVNYDYK